MEQLEQFVAALAGEHVVRPGRTRGRRLLPRLRENARVLLRAHRTIAEAGRRSRSVSPAAEWLLNNFHLVEEQIREIREDLPPGFYRELPKLASGTLEGYPRVYGLAWSFVAHTDSRIELATLRRFVLAYQRVVPLTIGELWALAISLRVVLVENLRRLAERITARGAARERADAIADALLGTDGAPKPEPAAVLQMLEETPFSQAFAVALGQRLREQDPAVTPALEWLDRRIAGEGTTAEDLVHVEHQAQIANHASVRNVITSMRLLSSADWADFFESVSLVHETLCDGSRVAEMDFATRDRYRHAIEELARGSSYDELEVARRAVALAAKSREDTRVPRGAAGLRFGDPGYYLISQGRHQLERELDFRVRGQQWVRRAWVRAATPLYLWSIALTTLVVLAVPVALTALGGVRTSSVVLLALLGLWPASDLAVELVHRFVTRLLGPRRLPKLELARGVPAELRTLVAIPMLLTDESEIEEVVQRLEVHYLANTDPELRFALLSDFSDAAAETLPEDAPLVALARDAIGQLNQRHGPAAGGGDRFWLLHRRRMWNASEGVWMGWERKRGKLRELNRLLRGATDTSFLAPDAKGPRAPSGIRYVITLDADSRLPREAARKLVGTMAHPLNLPGFDPAGRRVVEGHGLLQPRVTPMLPEIGWGTLFQFVFSGPRGIDLYAFAVSDVYQDLFGEGIFTGKGIYDVDAFEQALADRVPDNTQLSHDLFEGLFARAGFVSDIEVFEGFPGHYEVAVSRQHRWVRGDWQLLPWVLAPSRASPGPRAAVAIPAIGRWKMIDNLRRSLSAPATFATLLAAGACRGSVRGCGPSSCSAPCSSRRFFPSFRISFRRERGSPSGASSAGSRGISRSGFRRRRCGSSSLRIRRGCGPTRSCARSGGWQSRGATSSNGSPPRRRIARSISKRPASIGGCAAGSCWPPRPAPLSRRRARAPAPGRRPSSPPGSSRPWSRAGSACLPARTPPHASRRRRRARCARSPAGHGSTSSGLPVRSLTVCRPTTSRKSHSPKSRGALRRPTSDSLCSRPWRPTISAGSGPSKCSIAARRPWTRSAASSVSAVTSTTGTERTTSSRSSRATCPRSTAATWPPTC